MGVALQTKSIRGWVEVIQLVASVLGQTSLVPSVSSVPSHSNWLLINILSFLFIIRSDISVFDICQFELMTYRSETTNAVVFRELREKIKQVSSYEYTIQPTCCI